MEKTDFLNKVVDSINFIMPLVDLLNKDLFERRKYDNVELDLVFFNLLLDHVEVGECKERSGLMLFDLELISHPEVFDIIEH